MKKPQKSPDFPDSFYRVAVKGICVKDGKVMLVHDFTGRSDTDDRSEWELPGGGVDFDESLAEAIRREVKEEMNLKVSWIDEKPKYIWLSKREHNRGMEWYHVLTIVFHIELVDLNFTPSRECKEIKFFSKEELQENYDDLAVQIKPLVKDFNPSDFK